MQEIMKEERKKERVLITGGAGYIGSFLIGYLLEQGYHVTCLDTLSLKQHSLLHYASNDHFSFIYGDVRDKALLSSILPSFDLIIPLAAIVGAPACDARPHDAQTINYDAIALLDQLREPHQKIIYPTTNSGYGTKTGDLYCTEETPLEPISLYGRTKVDAERYLLESQKDAITFRLATVFGISPRMRVDLLVNDFVLKAMREGYIVIYEKDFKRNYIHIKDVARAFVHAIENFETMKNQAYNVGLEDANLSKAELAEKIKEYIPGFEIIYKDIGQDPDKRNYIVSNKKIMTAGFLPMYSLDYGIQELIKGYSILLRNDPHKNA